MSEFEVVGQSIIYSVCCESGRGVTVCAKIGSAPTSRLKDQDTIT